MERDEMRRCYIDKHYYILAIDWFDTYAPPIDLEQRCFYKSKSIVSTLVIDQAS